jgi:diacylglycerol kinase
MGTNEEKKFGLEINAMVLGLILCFFCRACIYQLIIIYSCKFVFIRGQLIPK